MIKKITLINFQIHKRLEIEFDKNFTVLIGSNNNGKSSIIRAINWVFYNEPSGDWMRRINKDDELENTKVKILFNDGTLISREKGDKINKYVVDGNEYENFGYGVPEKVLEKLKIYPLKTNKETFNINLSMQDEHPFLIQESSPVRSSVIDSLTGNSIIQRSISEFNKKSTNASKEQSMIESVIAEDENSLKSIPDIDFIQGLLEEVDGHTKNLRAVELEIVRALKIVGDLAIQRYKVNSYKEIDLEKIQTNIEKLNNLFEDTDELRNIGILLKINRSKIKVIPDLNELEELIEKLQKRETKLKDLKYSKHLLDKSEEELTIVFSQLTNANKELETFIKENPNCPTCGKELNL